ncbi:hypothetical protein U2075_14775, partial [Listeria monocytogenes]|uniref:hypothetical protein n=1 Tax=Listeria monocytogenes TaxID=1639 RepID=UPI003B5853CD
SREESFRNLGVRRLVVAPRHDVADGIHAGRNLIKLAWFDEKRCANGLTALQNYQREYDTKNKIFKDTPKHNWASHASDGWRLAGMALKP